MRKVAIFDVDGTIFRSSLLIELVETLIARGVFMPAAKTEYEREFKHWRNRQDTYEKYIQAVVNTFTHHIKGVSYKDFLRLSEEVVAEKKHHVYRYTRDLIKDLKEKKYFLLAISQSPKGTLDQFCEQLGFDKIYGRIYELGPQDGFTGRIVDEHLIANKANIVKRAIAKEKLTLNGSLGVGDTADDIPFLELVARPICFNPNQALYRYAKLNHWPIVVERKDVIYKIKSSINHNPVVSAARERGRCQ